MWILIKEIVQKQELLVGFQMVDETLKCILHINKISFCFQEFYREMYPSLVQFDPLHLTPHQEDHKRKHKKTHNL